MEYYPFVFFLFALGFIVQKRAWGFFDIANPVVLSLNYNLFFLSAAAPIYAFGIYPDYMLSHSTIQLLLLSYPITVISAYIVQVSISPRLVSGSVSAYSRFSLENSKGAFFYCFLLWALSLALASIFFVRTDFSTIKAIISFSSFEDERVIAVQGSGALILPAQILLIISTIWMCFSRRVPLIGRFFLFSLAGLILAAFGFRSGVAFLVLGCGATWVYKRYGKPSLGMLLALVSVIFVLLVAAGTIRQGSDYFLDRFLAQLFWRSFVTAHNAETILNGYNDFLYGYGLIMELSVVLPGADLNLGGHLKEVLGYNFPGGGITPSHVGAGFVDFGVFGALAYPAVAGIISSLSYVIWPALVGRSSFSFVLLLLFSVVTCGASAAGFVSPMLYFGIPILMVGFGYRVFCAIAVLNRK